ncbi:hypothetical protein AHAS_Ahas09G0195600 [Arachis hypogaea]
MGGIGKTTIARAVFETIRSRFEVTCFLADIRDQCEKKDIVHMQKQLLDQMNISSTAVYSEYDGRTIIQNSLHHKKVHETYKVEGLLESEAFNFFCLKAFKLPKPTEGFLDLSKEVVKYSCGLPLALKLLGSHLYGRSIKVLRKKDIFLEIACFFKGHEKDYVTKILEGCGHDAEIGIDILISRSLITLGKNIFGEFAVGMHDLLEEMGTFIEIQESPDNCSKRSKLWCEDDIDLVLKQHKESKTTHSIVLHGMELYKTAVRWRDLSFSNICQLKLLILDDVKAPILNNILSSLRVLQWRGCPMETMPLTDQYYELVEIDLCRSSIVIPWNGKKSCNNLEILGDKMEMSSLNKLDLLLCDSLRKLPEFGKCMKQLSILNLGGTEIEELPTMLGNLVGLSELGINGYSEHRSVPNIVGVLCSMSRLTSLSSLKLWGCFPAESALYYNLGRLSSLTYLDLSWNRFARVPLSIHELPRLTRLQLYLCHKLEVLPELPSSLRELDASSCTSLDASYVNDVIPKMCHIFVESARQDCEDVFQVLIPKEEILAWFDHQEQEALTHLNTYLPFASQQHFFCKSLFGHRERRGSSCKTQHANTSSSSLVITLHQSERSILGLLSKMDFWPVMLYDDDGFICSNLCLFHHFATLATFCGG